MLTEDKKVILKAARDKALAGKSPRQVGAEKQKAALLWMYNWGWSTPSVLEIVGRDNRNGLVSRLIKNGLVLRTQSESGGGQRGVPTYILTLTTAGIETVEKDFTSADSLLPVETNPYRINQALLRHDTLAQVATANNIIPGTITGYRSEFQLRQKSQENIKQPDAVWLHADGSQTAIEVELSAKWGRDFDQFLHKCLLSLASGQEGAPPRFSRIAVASDSPAIIDRYKSAFAAGQRYSLWKKDDSRHWVVCGEKSVPAWVQSKVLFQLIGKKKESA